MESALSAIAAPLAMLLQVARETADHERETRAANQEIKELKEELQKNKTISDIEFKFEEKKLRAREQALSACAYRADQVSPH